MFEYFTVWIFIWCILYFLHFFTFNPSFLLIIVNIFHIYSIIYLYHYVNIFIFIEMVFISSIFILFHFIIKLKVSIKDIIFSIVLFVLYNIYLYVFLKSNILKIYSQYYENRKNNKSAMMIFDF